MSGHDEDRAASAARIDRDIARLKAESQETGEAIRRRAERAERMRLARERNESDIVAECEAEGVNAYDGGPIPVSMALRRLLAEHRRNEEASA
jgi:phage protein D